MKILKYFVALNFLMITVVTETYGKVAILCITPISKSAVVDEMSGAPREQWGKPLPSYSVQVDSSPIVKVDNKTPVKIKFSNTLGAHMIKIYANGVLNTSFTYSPKTIDVLAMSEVGYQTWDWVKFKSTQSAMKYCNTQGKLSP